MKALESKSLLFLVLALIVAACKPEVAPEPVTKLDGTVWAKHYNDKVSPWQKVLEFKSDRLKLKWKWPVK